ncbi:hypothetical protein H4R19_005340, partial [Coemansia spiralis]
MQSVWVHFRGLTPGNAAQDLRRLTDGRAVRIDVQATTRTEVAGRFEVASVDVARQLLEHTNYSMFNHGSVVPLSMGPEYLAGCKQVVLEGIPTLDGEERRLYEYCRRFGVVCALQADGSAGRVWMDSEDGAQGLVLSVKTGGYYGRRLQAYIEETGMEAIVVDSDNDDKRATAVPVPAPAPAPRVIGAARKSTGKRRRGLVRGSDRQGKVLRTETEHIQQRPDSSPPQPDEAQADASDHAHVRNIMDMTLWRAKAPFIYESIYRRVPEVADTDSRCCLSMAWCAGEQPGTLSCYLSQGNSLAASVARNWSNMGYTPDGASSTITMTAFDLPARRRAAGIRSLLGAFNSTE